MPVEAKKHEPYVLRAMASEWKKAQKGDSTLTERWKLNEEAESVYLRCAELEELIAEIGAQQSTNGVWFLPFYLKDKTCEMMSLPLWIKKRQEAAELLATSQQGQ